LFFEQADLLGFFFGFDLDIRSISLAIHDKNRSLLIPEELIKMISLPVQSYYRIIPFPFLGVIQTEQELEDPEVAVVDIGHQHDPKLNNFDHHQLSPRS
jgi:hypothetical protein